MGLCRHVSTTFLEGAMANLVFWYVMGAIEQIYTVSLLDYIFTSSLAPTCKNKRVSMYAKGGKFGFKHIA